jgi:polysaccharide export outer membrane protein
MAIHRNNLPTQQKVTGVNPKRKVPRLRAVTPHFGVQAGLLSRGTPLILVSLVVLLTLVLGLNVSNTVWAAEDDLKVIESGTQVQGGVGTQSQSGVQNVVSAQGAELSAKGTEASAQSVQASTQAEIQELKAAEAKIAFAGPVDSSFDSFDPLNYTLGPEDVIQIDVQRHTEFSGVYPVDLEGKIQYKFVGDMEVTGLKKSELEEKIKKQISKYIINPEVSVTILDYKSKVIYVLGEVAKPGKYYMKSESISIREAVVVAGLPTYSAAMRKCRLITPTEKGKVKTKNVDVFAILYGGELNKNIDMKPGDVLYVPATVMAKVMRVINPVTAPITNAASGKSAATGLGL